MKTLRRDGVGATKNTEGKLNSDLHHKQTNN